MLNTKVKGGGAGDGEVGGVYDGTSSTKPSAISVLAEPATVPLRMIPPTMGVAAAAHNALQTTLSNLSEEALLK